MHAPLPPNEIERLAALHASGILDTAPEPAFDDIVRLAALICGTPVSAVSLIDASRQWFKAIVGLPPCETDRRVAFCAHTILNPGQLLVVPDARLDPRFADNPGVTGEPHLRFYAGVPLVDRAGFAIGSLCVTDITPRTLSAAQLDALATLGRHAMREIESRQLVATLGEQKLALDHHALVAIADVTGCLTYANDRFCTLLDCAAAELLRDNCGFARDIFSSAWPTVSAGEVWHGEVSLRNGTGRALWVQATVVPLKGANGRPWQYLAVGTDLTERKAAETELHRARESALESARAKSRFLANMSHELRTPLNTVNGLSATLVEQDLPAPAREAARLILQCGETLLEHIQTILTHSSLEAGKTQLDTRPFSPAEIALKALRMTGEIAQRKGLTLDCAFAPDLPAAMTGDPFRLQQILVNLLANAVKFTESGRVCLRLGGRLQPDGRWELRFLITDTGVGIAPENLSLLFQPFSQAGDSAARRSEGTGLGLAITKTLVDLMGGHVAVRSRPGRGTVFRVCLPFDAIAGTVPISAGGALPALVGRRLLVDLPPPLALCRKMVRELADAWGLHADIAGASAPGGAYDFILRQAPAGAPFLPAQIGDTPVLWLSHQPLATGGRTLCDPFAPDELAAALAALLRPTVSTSPIVPVAAARKLGERVPLRILSADDIPTNRDLLRFLCHHLGYRTDLVENGAEVLVRLATHQYDLILLDMQMPVMDGLTVAREICRAFPNPKRRPKLVAVTAGVQPGNRESCLAAGMDDYLAKPLLPLHLQQCIERLFTPDTTSAPPMPVELPVLAPWVDADHLRAMTTGMEDAGAREIIAGLSTTVIADFQLLRPRLATACALRSTADLLREVHGLKGCVLAIGWARLGRRCADILTELRQEKFTAWQTLPGELDHLQRASAAALDAYLNRSRAPDSRLVSVAASPSAKPFSP